MLALQKAFARFNRLVDWFIPAAMDADRTMRKQAQMFLVSHICGPFIGNSVPGAIYLLDPHPGYQNLVLAGSITGFWIFPFLLKYVQHYNALAIVSIQNLMFCIIWSCLMLGGIQSPTAPWVLTIPLLSFFYLGSAPEIRLLVLLMFIANFAAFWILSDTGIVVPSHIAPIAAQALGIVSTVAAAAYVAMMALFYAKALATQGELETEMKDHIATALELQRAAAAADQADALKAEFLARLGSELRIPLHAVIGYSSILVEDAEEKSPRSLNDLKSIRDSGLELLRFVNDVLDLSKMETGRMEIFSDVFDVADLLRNVTTEMTPLAQGSHNRLELHVEGQLGLIASDMRKIRIVLTQLLSNAAKFTRGGSIDVHAGMRSQGPEDTPMLLVTVSDTGTGISPDRMENLFEQFALNDDASASKYGGSGLGLALSRKLCRLLGGDIDVETTVGKGTRFTFWIPTGSPRAAFVEGERAASHPAEPGGSAIALGPLDQEEQSVLRHVA